MRTQKNLLTTAAAIAVMCVSLGCQTEKNKDGRSAGRTLDDKNITKEVKTALKDEPAYKFSGVNVYTYAGTVQLSGFVDTQAQKQRAEQLARSVDGVQTVANGIAVKPEMPATPTGRMAPKDSGESSRIFAEPQKQSTVNQQNLQLQQNQKEDSNP
jgi:hyperosmotically inducible periplasmic protein